MFYLLLTNAHIINCVQIGCRKIFLVIYYVVKRKKYAIVCWVCAEWNKERR